MERYVEFAHQCLPSLMELAKYGGRVAGPRGMAGLRESLVDSVKSGADQWKAKVVPERFSELVHVEKIGEGHPDWASDKLDSCQLCAEKFTMTNRRHHCRVSGVLVCTACSTKRLPYYRSGAPHNGKGNRKRHDSTNSTGDSSDEMIRVSDGAFNRLYYSCESREKDIAIQIKTIKQRQEIGVAAQKKKEGEDNLKAGGLFNWSSGSATRGNTKDSKKPQSSVASMHAQNNETMQALQDRGEKLEQLNVRAGEMNDAASDFQANAAKLLRQQQERKWYA